MNSKTVLELEVHLEKNLKLVARNWLAILLHAECKRYDSDKLQTLTVKSCLPLVINTFNGGMLTLLPCCSTAARMAF